MRIYIAAPWVDRDKVREAAQLFSARGHIITRDWWNHDAEGGYLQGGATIEQEKALAEQAKADMFGVMTSQVFIVLNTGKSEGKAVETGIALMSEGCHTFIRVGPISNIFHYLPCWVDVETVEEAVEVLDKYV